MNRDFNTLLIPVESQVRELDGKLLLACVAAEKGFNSIIGSRAYVHYHASKVHNSIYLAKSMRRFSKRMFKILRSLGHRIVAWDEEGLVQFPDQQYYLHRLDPTTFSYIDHLFAWGNSDAQVFNQYPAYKGQPIHIVGNPRIDLLRPELRNYFLPEVENIISRYNKYILINTNFGQVNHFIPDVGSDEANRDKNFSEATNDSFISNRYSHKEALFSHFKTLIPLLAETFPETNIIVRPHPSENVQSWQHHLKNNHNVIVANNGNVIPWIMGSQALISNGCTTSIEATVLGKPTLGYYPISNSEIDDVLPKMLCDISTTNDHLLQNVEKVLSNNYLVTNNDTTILSKHISSIKGIFATDQIIATLDEQYTQTSFQQHSTMSRIRGIAHNNARTLFKRVKSKKASNRNSANYHKHRFPPLDIHYLHDHVSRLQSLTGRFANINITNISADVFQIEAQ